MFPSNSIKNWIDAVFPYTKLFGKFKSSVFIGDIRRTNFKNLFFRQFGLAVSFPSRYAALLRHIFIVYVCSSNKQMVRVNTRRVIAGMKNPFSFWYISIMQKPRNAMGSGDISVFKSPISIPIFKRFPYPARFCFFNILKKSFMYWLNKVIACATMTFRRFTDELLFFASDAFFVVDMFIHKSIIQKKDYYYAFR